MALGGRRMPNTKTQSEAIREPGVGEIKTAAAVESVEQALILVVAGAQAEAHQIERRFDRQFEALVALDPGSELLRQSHVLANVEAQAFYAVVAQHKPQLQGTEAAPQGDMPVAVVDDRARLGGLVAQIFGRDAQGF